jgi:LmeA-like phospholipid-binding
MLRKLLLGALIALVGLYVAADFGAKALAERGVSREVQTSLRLSERPDVSLGGFPFIPKLVSGSFDTVTVTARGFVSGNLRFGRVDMTLHHVTCSAWQILRGASTTIDIASGAGTATLSAADANQVLRGAGISGSVRFRDGNILLQLPGGSGSVAVSASVHGRTLTLRSAAGTIRLPLPEVVPGLRYTGVHVGARTASFSVAVGKTSLRIA